MWWDVIDEIYINIFGEVNLVIFIVVYIFGKKSTKLCTGTQRYNLPVFLYSAFKNKLYSTFIQQKISQTSSILYCHIQK